MATTLSPPCLVLNATSMGNDDSRNDLGPLPIIVHLNLRVEDRNALAICLYMDDVFDPPSFDDTRLPYGGFVTILSCLLLE